MNLQGTSQQAAVENSLRQAAAALQSGRAQDAERISKEVLSRNAKHPSASQLLGMALLAQDRGADAVAPLRDAHRARANAAVETYLAAALRKTDRADEALALLQQAITRQPPLPHAFYELGSLLYEQRRLNEAQEVLERGLAVAPQVAEFSVTLGNIFSDRGQSERAEAAFARALTIMPGHPDALRGLGCSLMGRGHFAGAAERFTQALGRNPNDARTQLLLATCLFELGKTDEAIERLRAVVGTTPQLFGQAVKAMTEAGHGRLWLKPSAAAKFLGVKN